MTTYRILKRFIIMIIKVLLTFSKNYSCTHALVIRIKTLKELIVFVIIIKRGKRVIHILTFSLCIFIQLYIPNEK